MSSKAVLQDLGFTAHESDVFEALIQASPQTGYGLAKMLGKPAAQVYTALDSLSRKGAAIGTANEPRSWRPVEPELLFEQLEEDFQRRRDRAERLLAQLGPVAADWEVYKLTTPEQVYSRSRQMMAEASSVILLDCFPGPIAQLGESVREAAARGVTIGAITYGEMDLPDAAVVARSGSAAAILEDVPGDILQCSVDGTQYVAALFDEHSSVRTAFWTENALVAGLAHNGLAAELGFHLLSGLDSELPDTEALRSLQVRIAELAWRSTPGYRQLCDDRA
jgi:sugar-specific transcriptional regulator TrmB